MVNDAVHDNDSILGMSRFCSDQLVEHVVEHIVWRSIQGIAIATPARAE